MGWLIAAWLQLSSGYWAAATLGEVFTSDKVSDEDRGVRAGVVAGDEVHSMEHAWLD